MSTVALGTLGCKVNQCETAYLQEQLASAGFRIRPFSDKAEIYCINTCTVTARAAMQSRQLIRRAIRRNPGARVVAMGCYPQVAPEEIAAICGVTHILGTLEKLALLDHLTASGPLPYIRVGDPRRASNPLPLHLSGFTSRTRAFLKIQDGCDAHCSYCIVPFARGRSRSTSLASVEEQAKTFLDHGYQEIVLTGIHLGHWGRDLRPPLNLVALLEAILRDCPPPRLRLSSIEPGEITSRLLELIATRPEFCPHLHLPLQSGDPMVLRRMNRHYHPDRYRELVAEALTRIPDLAIGADILVGFPGETEACFHRTCSLVESLPLAYLHVFPFSARPGTPAAGMAGRVDPGVIRARCLFLRKLDQEKRLAFRRNFLGRVREILVEKRLDHSSGMRCGFTDNYLPVVVQGNSVPANKIIRARLDRFLGGRLLAIPV